MMELIKWQSAINASMHYQMNGSKGILKMFIRLLYEILLLLQVNKSSLTRNKLLGLTNGYLKMKSRQWMSARIGENALIFFTLLSLALKLSMLAAVHSAIL